MAFSSTWSKTLGATRIIREYSGASTALSHEAEREDSISSLLGILPALQRAHPDMDPETLIALASKADFAGNGQTNNAGTDNNKIIVSGFIHCENTLEDAGEKG